jgi:cytoskeletal protein CcmA (bactofilin family)
MARPLPRLDERGVALITVLLIALALAALAFGAAMVSMNGGLIRRYGERFSTTENAALAGLEEARSRLNGDRTLYPDSGFVLLEDSAEVRNATGAVLPGVRRWTWAGPSGVSSGQYGVFGSIISEARATGNVRVVRRLEVTQESFAKYAYFTDFEPSTIAFGAGDQIFGPVHSNDDIQIYASGARFRGTVRTAGRIIGRSYGIFDQGYTENVPPIAMPTVAELTRLRNQATAGGTYVAGFTTAAEGQARTRLEFVAIDLNGDGDATDDDEGFMRVYEGAIGREAYVVADRPGTMTTTINCGDFQGPHAPNFLPADAHPTTGGHAKQASLNDNSARCFLGGDPALTNGFVAVTPGGLGRWLAWTGPVDPRLGARPDRNHLFPISRALNPNFKGVIYVDGDVAISGTVRGRITIVSPQDIVVVDNLRQATDPATGTCGDIVGLIGMDDVVVADNMLNAPVNVQGSTFKTMRPVGNQDEVVHAVVLALDLFTVENFDAGPTNREQCGTTNWGRGCLALTGGIIQRTRGAVGTTSGTGNLKRYQYNACAYSDPPPYFPTTGHFDRNRTYDIDPGPFDVAAWFDAYQH